jgi:hypothetical protein
LKGFSEFDQTRFARLSLRNLDHSIGGFRLTAPAKLLAERGVEG